MNGENNSSGQKLFRVMGAMQWLVLPAIAVIYARAWNQLPARLATHFDFNNQPNGWMSREGSLIFSLVMATIFALLGSWALLRIARPGVAAWALMSFFYVILGTLLWATTSVIAYNTEHQPVEVAPVLMAGIAAAIVVIALTLATRRGQELPTSPIFADERHSSSLFAAVLGLPALAILAITFEIPTIGLRVAMAFAVLLMFGAAGLAWDGFHYLFSPSGVEIRTLGFRLRSIPANEIQSYAMEPWNISRGYGIRGVGDVRAYVWSNTGVRIRTTEGEVFLGHKEPGRIIHDLDSITKKART
jgi:hypothetical protein